MALTRIPATVTKVPATVTKVPGTIAGIPTNAGLTRIPDGGGGASPPVAPTLTAPSNNANVFNGIAVTVSATTTDLTLTKMEWVLDPSGANTVVATVVGSGTPAGTFSTTWTATGVSIGAHTLVARATNGTGSTDSASISINVSTALWTLVSSVTVLRAWQSDFGITMGATPLASGTTPPAVTLTGSVTTNPALRVEIQTTGARGAATFRYGALNTGSTSVSWIEQNVVTAATYPAIGALSGFTLNFAAGTYTNDNVYQGTCSSWTDQKNGISASNGTPAQQPLILWSTTTSRIFLRFDGVDDNLAETTIDLPAPGTTPTLFHSVMTQRAWTASRGPFSAAQATGSMQLTGTVGTPSMQQYDGVLRNSNSGATLGTLVRGEVFYSNSVSDRVKLGSSSVTGISAGNLDPSIGCIIGANTTSATNSGAFDFYYHAIYNGNATELASMDTVMSSMYSGIVV